MCMSTKLSSSTLLAHHRLPRALGIGSWSFSGFFMTASRPVRDFAQETNASSCDPKLAVTAMAEGGDAPQHIQLKVKDQQGSEVGVQKKPCLYRV